MTEFSIKFRYVKDTRRWEDIPYDNKEYGSLSEAIDSVLSFIMLWNNLKRNETTKIFEARLNMPDSYQGYYVTDWSQL